MPSDASPEQAAPGKGKALIPGLPGKSILLLVVVLGLAVAFLGRFDFPARAAISNAGLIAVAMLSVLALLLYTWKSPRLPRQSLFVAIGLMLLFLWYVALALDHGANALAVQRAVLVLISALAFLFAATYSYRSSGPAAGTHGALIGVTLVALGAFVLATDVVGQRLINPNSVGMIAFTLIALLFAFRTHRAYPLTVLILVAGLIFLSFAVSARAALMGLVAFFLVYYFWRLVTHNLLFHWAVFFGAIVFNVAWIILLVSPEWPLFATIDAYSRDIFGTRIASGRNVIWSQLFVVMSERPLVGWGPGVHLADVTDVTLSAHNLYLQTVLQVGLVGLALLALVLAAIWHGAYRRRDSHLGRVAGAFLIGHLLLQNFEVTLTQNLFVFGLAFWLVAGLALGERQGEAPSDTSSRNGRSLAWRLGIRRPPRFGQTP